MKITKNTIWYCKKNQEHYIIIGTVSVKLLGQRTEMVLYSPLVKNDHSDFYSKTASIFKSEFILSGDVEHDKCIKIGNETYKECPIVAEQLKGYLILLKQHKLLDHFIIDWHPLVKKIKELLELK